MRRARNPAQRVNGSRADRYLHVRPVQAVSFEGKFADPRWVNGTWDLAQFNGANGETDWDAVIDAEVRPTLTTRPRRVRRQPSMRGTTVNPHTR